MTETTENPNSDVSASTPPKREHGLLSRLYTGTGAFEIVGKRRRYYIATAVIIAVCVISMLVRGFTFSIDFEGGTKISFPSTGESTSQVSEVFANALGTEPVSVQTAGNGASQTIQVRSEHLDAGQILKVQNAMYQAFHPKDRSGVASPNAVSVSAVSSTWGGAITQKALLALVVFLVIVAIYITIRFERDMAIAGLAALVFDMTVTAGLYSLIGFEVSPATVIGFLTILGFSLYDTVVVFDKVEENTRGVLHLTRRTYAEQANLAVNQTLMRSINTTVISILPVLGLMVVAVWMLGVGTLKDLALVQLVGIIVGAYSSIFFATPLLVTLKERSKKVGDHTRKVLARRERLAQQAKEAAPDAASERNDEESFRGARADGVEQSVDSGDRPPRRSVADVAGMPRRSAGMTPRPGAKPVGKPTGKRRRRS